MVIEAVMPSDPMPPDAIGQLKQAIDANHVERVRILMTANPALHRAPTGYGNDGPLTWVAECRVPWEPPGKARLAMARWMIDRDDAGTPNGILREKAHLLVQAVI